MPLLAYTVGTTGFLLMLVGLASAAGSVYRKVFPGRTVFAAPMQTDQVLPGAEQINSLTSFVEAVLKGPSWFVMYVAGLAAASVGHWMGAA